jgi:hypothetical protein
LILGLGVRNRDPRASGLQKERGGDTGFTESDHQHAFVVYVHRDIFRLPIANCYSISIDNWQSQIGNYLNFNVVNANNANTSDAIQKRTMIFDSDQPSNSK